MSCYLPGGIEKDAVRIALFAASVFAFWAYYSALKMEAVYPTETPVSFHCTERSNILDDSNDHFLIYLLDSY
jgi:hypothetical protein